LVVRLTGSPTAGELAMAALFVAGIVCLWSWRRHLVSVEAAVALGLIVTMLAAPHLFPEDFVFLTIPLAWVARRDWKGAFALALLLSAASLPDKLVRMTIAEPLLLIGVLILAVQSVASFGIGRYTASKHDGQSTKARPGAPVDGSHSP
jgi:hypothetical protein